MTKFSKAATFGATVCSALFAVALVGCGSSGSTSTSKSGVTTLAPATGPKLDLVAVKATTEKQDAVESHMIITIKSGDEDLTMEQIYTVSKSTKRVRIENLPNKFSGAYTMISGIDNDFYVKGSQGWTKVTLDPSLVDAAKDDVNATSFVDAVSKLTSDIRQDGTMELDGVTVKRYRANVNGDDLYAWFKDSSPLKQMAAQMPDITDAVGSVEVGVDDSGFARSVDIQMSFTADDEPGSIGVNSKSKPLPAGTTVDPPPADQITSTKSVSTMDELGSALQAAMA